MALRQLHKILPRLSVGNQVEVVQFALRLCNPFPPRPDQKAEVVKHLIAEEAIRRALKLQRAFVCRSWVRLSNPPLSAKSPARTS